MEQNILNYSEPCGKNLFEIIAYEHTTDIIDFDNLIVMVKDQLSFIGYQQSKQEVSTEILNSMKEESRSILFVAYDKNMSSIGFAFGNICCGLECGGDYFWVNEVYVSPLWRTKGLGTSLVTYIDNYIKKKGCIYLALVTHPKNYRAISFYESLKFETESLVWVDKYL